MYDVSKTRSDDNVISTARFKWRKVCERYDFGEFGFEDFEGRFPVGFAESK